VTRSEGPPIAPWPRRISGIIPNIPLKNFRAVVQINHTPRSTGGLNTMETQEAGVRLTAEQFDEFLKAVV
jgi:hypothetical protein